MSAGSMKPLPEKGIAPLNFIYACSVCCASFADVYQGHNESVRGLSDGINPKERLVAKLYLAACCHVFCSNHLEGRGECTINHISTGLLTYDITHRTTIPPGRTATKSTLSCLH